MLVWICKRMSVPIHFGIIHAINPPSSLNHGKCSLICFQIVKDIDKSIRHRQVNSNMKDINIQNSFFEMANQRRIPTCPP